MRGMGRNKTFIIIALLALAVIAAGIAAIYYSRNYALPISLSSINGKSIVNAESKDKGRGNILPPRITPPPSLRKSAGSIEIIYPAGGELLQTGVSYVIRWKSKAIGGEAVMRVGYRPVSAPGTATTQIVRTTNVGSASWLTPSFIDPAEISGESCAKGKMGRQDYIVDVIWVSSDGAYLARDASEPFAIEGPCGSL